jgi:hypothetical protein
VLLGFVDLRCGVLLLWVIEIPKTIFDGGKFSTIFDTKVETPVYDSIRELVSWECKEHGVES